VSLGFVIGGLGLAMIMTPQEFYQDLWHHKTRVSRLSYGLVVVILYLAILVQYWLVLDGPTDARPRHILRSIKSCCRKLMFC